jgi:hypothetical protein
MEVDVSAVLEPLGDCGDVVASLWPVTIAPRLVREATETALGVIGSALGVDLTAIYRQLDETIDPAVYTATAVGAHA